MRRFACFLFFLQLLLSTSLLSQPVDTATRRYDSARKVVEQTVKDWQDSMDHEKMLQDIRKNSKPLDEFLAEMKEKERKENRRRWIRIGAGATLLFMLFFSIARRYIQQKRA